MELGFEELLDVCRLGRVAQEYLGEELPSGNVAQYPTAVLTATRSGWLRAWPVQYSTPPGTPLPPGVHEVTISATVAPKGEQAVTVAGSFFIGVGVAEVPPRTLKFTDSAGRSLSAPEWRVQLPQSQLLSADSPQEVRDLLNHLAKEGETAFRDAVLACEPAAQRYASQRRGALLGLPELDIEDLQQAVRATVVVGVGKYTSSEPPNTSFSHWLHQEARKAVQRALSKASGVSVETSDILWRIRKRSEAGETYSSAEQLAEDLAVDTAINRLLQDRPEMTRREAEAEVAERVRLAQEWNEAFAAEMSVHEEALNHLRECDDLAYAVAATAYQKHPEFPRDASREEQITWIALQLERRVRSDLTMRGYVEESIPESRYSLTHIEQAMKTQSVMSLDKAVADEGTAWVDALPADNGYEYEEVELREYLRVEFAKRNLSPEEQLVFLLRSNVLGSGHVQPWSSVVESLGLSNLDTGAATKVARRLLQSAQRKMRGEVQAGGGDAAQRAYERARAKMLHPAARSMPHAPALVTTLLG